MKDALVQRTAGSEQRRLQQLFNTEELGDRKPTQLLRHMQQLLGDKATGLDPSFIHELFLQRLPTNVRLILASTAKAISLQELATLADKVMEVATPTVATVSPSDSLVAEISELKAEITQVKQLLKHRPVLLVHEQTVQLEPIHPLIQICAGIIRSLESRPKSANHLVLRRETSRPVTSGDGHHWL